MSTIVGGSIKHTASTYVVPSDGTATTLSSLGIKDGKTLETFLASDTDFLLRRSLAWSSRQAVVSPSAPNGYTQARNNVLLRFPKLLANGKYTVNTVRIEQSFDVECTTGEKTDQILLASQALGDADFRDFWIVQALG